MFNFSKLLTIVLMLTISGTVLAAPKKNRVKRDIVYGVIVDGTKEKKLTLGVGLNTLIVTPDNFDNKLTCKLLSGGKVVDQDVNVRTCTFKVKVKEEKPVVIEMTTTSRVDVEVRHTVQ